MHIPTTTPVGTVVPITGVDATLHTFVGASWHILLPYTLFGACIMVYGQSRLLTGQRALDREAGKSLKETTPKTSRKA